MTKVMRWMISLFAVIIVAGLVLAGCGQETTEPPPPPPTGPRVLEVSVIDTDEYQGFMPNNFTAKAGEEIELRITNEDFNARTTDPAANHHPIILTGPGVNMGIPSLNPGQTKSLTFTVQAGTYNFLCAEGACDIHALMVGTIEVTP